MKKQPIIKDSTGYIDSIISNYIVPTLPIWHSIGATPNMLTTLGLLSSIMSLVFFYKSNKLYSIIFFLFRWYFDYADGMLARKYKQTTKFGDWYDHITDWFFWFGITYMIYIKSKTKSFHISILVISTILFGMHQGCIEKANSKYNKKATSLSWLKHICSDSKFIYAFDNTILYMVLIFLIYDISK